MVLQMSFSRIHALNKQNISVSNTFIFGIIVVFKIILKVSNNLHGFKLNNLS